VDLLAAHGLSSVWCGMKRKDNERRGKGLLSPRRGDRGRVPRFRLVAGLIGCVSMLGCAHLVPKQVSDAGVQQDLVFVYVHGFGGAKATPRFCENLRKFVATVPYRCDVRNYPWDSVRIDVMKAGAKWLEAEAKADVEAEVFKKRIIDPLEAEKTPYVLVGFSVGSRVILRALEASAGNLQMLRGVYFLGSAMTRDTSVKNGTLPAGMRITNYHSPHKDTVHRLAFNFMKSTAAGGYTGFTDTKVFENYPVSCSHTHKGIGAHIDYSQLAYAIGYVALMRERLFVPGSTAYNIPTRVADGNKWWNRILRLDYTYNNQPCTLEIEQYHLNQDYFRAVVVLPDNKRRRLARGNNIHAIIDDLGALPQSYWSPANGTRRLLGN
jgi:hypothetical protein